MEQTLKDLLKKYSFLLEIGTEKDKLDVLEIVYKEGVIATQKEALQALQK